jgi:hypothetical protein
VQALGGAKAVSHRLWPTKPVGDAHRDLLDALNRERARKLELHEVNKILRMAQEIGFHSAKRYFDAEAGYEPGKPLNPMDERDELMRRYIETVHASKVIADRMERLTQPPLQAVK